MNVLRHDNVSINVETVTFPYSFERILNHQLGLIRAQKRLTTMATEGYEVQMAGLLIAL
jgi:hypothetical protein